MKRIKYPKERARGDLCNAWTFCVLQPKDRLHSERTEHAINGHRTSPRPCLAFLSSSTFTSLSIRGTIRQARGLHAPNRI